MLFTRSHINIPCVILKVHEVYSDSQKLPTVVSFNVLDSDATVGVTYMVRMAAVQRLWSFFFLPFFSLSLDLGICAKPLNIQLYPPECICFEFISHSFDFYFFILMFLEVFFYFIPHHLISLDLFCIQSSPHSFILRINIFLIFSFII